MFSDRKSIVDYVTFLMQACSSTEKKFSRLVDPIRWTRAKGRRSPDRKKEKEKKTEKDLRQMQYNIGDSARNVHWIRVESGFFLFHRLDDKGIGREEANSELHWHRPLSRPIARLQRSAIAAARDNAYVNERTRVIYIERERRDTRLFLRSIYLWNRWYTGRMTISANKVSTEIHINARTIRALITATDVAGMLSIRDKEIFCLNRTYKFRWRKNGFW